jgi:hypothetical protein
MRDFFLTAVVVLSVMGGTFYTYLWSTGFKSSAQIEAEDRQECVAQCKQQGAVYYIPNPPHGSCECVFSLKGKR